MPASAVAPGEAIGFSQVAPSTWEGCPNPVTMLGPRSGGGAGSLEGVGWM